MQQIKTKDGSITYYNKQFDECYHSKSGALQEAKLKFAKALAVKDGDTILDICFGLGYNSYQAMLLAKNLKIVGLELDPNILDKALEINIDNKFERIKQAIKHLEFKDEEYEIKIIMGNASKTITQVNGKFDIVFLDPFSPKKCPNLWTKEFFENIKKIMSPNGKLATYSCARVVRDNLKAAGFKIENGIQLHRRGPSTIAFL